MKISQKMKKSFTDEVDFVIKNMQDTDSFKEKLYFFSAIQGQAQRTVNFEYDPELLFIYQVTQLVYNIINARISAMKTGQEDGISIPEGLFQGLDKAIKERAGNIKDGNDSYGALQTMVNIAYATTGNGYYMYLRGVLPVE